MTLQRRGRNAQLVTLYALKVITDGRGNRQQVVDREHSVTVRAAVIPQRGSEAELPGQQPVDVYRIIVPATTPDVGLWNIVAWRGREWDIVTPPIYHHGTGATRHYSVDVRLRPAAAPEGGADG